MKTLIFSLIIICSVWVEAKPVEIKDPMFYATLNPAFVKKLEREYQERHALSEEAKNVFYLGIKTYAYHKGVWGCIWRILLWPYVLARNVEPYFTTWLLNVMYPDQPFTAEEFLQEDRFPSALAFVREREIFGAIAFWVIFGPLLLPLYATPIQLFLSIFMILEGYGYKGLVCLWVPNDCPYDLQAMVKEKEEQAAQRKLQRKLAKA